MGESAAEETELTERQGLVIVGGAGALVSSEQ
jgi:hypothetical protein